MQNKSYDPCKTITITRSDNSENMQTKILLCIDFFFEMKNTRPRSLCIEFRQRLCSLTRPKMLIMLNSCSTAGQLFYKFFCPGSKSVCLLIKFSEAKSFIIKYLCLLHSMIYASHRIGDSGQWIMARVEKCVRGFIFLI